MAFKKEYNTMTGILTPLHACPCSESRQFKELAIWIHSLFHIYFVMYVCRKVQGLQSLETYW
jgi:hypothetical protein